MNKDTPTAGIFIPTMNRVDHVIRQLRYYAYVRCPHTIYIGDSSPKEESYRIQNEINRLGDKIKAIYKYLPNHDSWQAHFAMILEVREKYICYSGDDDYQIPASVTKCIQFLEKNNDYSSASGYAVSFRLKTSSDHNLYGDLERLADYPRQQIEDESASDRIVKFFNNYYVTHFSVNRTEILVKSWGQSKDMTDDTLKAEILPTSLPMIEGKSKILDCLGFIRQIHAGRTLILDLPILLVNEKWQSSYKILQSKLSEAISLKDKIGLDDAGKIAQKAFWGYIAKQLLKDYTSIYPDLFTYSKGSNHHSLKVLKANLGLKFPTVKSGYKQILRSLIGGGLAPLHYEVLQKRSKYYKDFKTIMDSFTGKINI
jgi:glycosyltransferase domain-containing protein